MKFTPLALLSIFGVLSSKQFITHAEDVRVPAASVSHSDVIMTEDQLASMEGTSEKFEFQAEVNRLMDIVINSLYKNKEIFLRELISNASDALDKIRFKSIEDKDALAGEKNLEVRISFDRESRTVTIADTGVGMTKTELIENLGTVAKSGTTNFMEQLGGESSTSGDDLSMIGQFGVGFYSIYLVSDRVTVASKSNDDPDQHVWTSMADGSFVVGKDPRGNTLGRGTEITMYLKDDASEFLDDYKLESMVKKYSEFITFPIYLRKTVAETVLAEGEEEEYEDGEEEDDLDDLDEGEEDDEEEEVVGDKYKVGDVEVPVGEGGYDPDEDSPHDPSIKTEVFKFEWVRANDNVAIWSREKEEVTDDEYKEFYTNLSKDGTTSENWIHFKAEGEVEFKGIMYIPDEAPHDMWDRYYDKEAKIRLYVRKVLISDEFDDLVPQYLNFIRGVIDSDDLPLNVNRESLQQSKILKVMGKKIVRKALEMLRKMATQDKDFEEDEEDKDEKGEVKKAPYIRFWEQFGKSMKLGVIEDSSNRSKLIKLLRYRTSTTGEDSWRSLEDYVADMKEWQQHIYYIAGADIETVSKSAFCEKLHKKGLEILYLVDPIDEYAMQQITEFDGKRLMSVTKEGLKFGDEDEDLVAGREKAYNKKFQPLTRFLKQTYDKNVNKVVVSQRVEDSPVVIVTGQWGNSANMERIMRAQAFSDSNKNSYLNAQKTMEINPRHPLITKLLEMVLEDERSQAAKDAAMMLYDTASLISGFQIEEIEDFNTRMLRVLKDNMGVESFDLEEEIEPEEEEEDEEDEEDEEENAFDIDDLEGVGSEL
eukprot:CAMPEP_0182503768 /NCGR_PEP_ID=MMETSP1321-20130603/15948_1 /TAXON_ID=91990 /ORGANISM="Bolidomonas sp., Strain RCC1657" /LENGTH=818 /DNA_ID=CAMNT_0024708991 /DNA_START=49 /DNA_END=2505 /DNA_ORIENTATION=-